MPSSVEIGLPNGLFIEQPVIFETLPHFCKSCQSIGHTSTNCGKNSAQPLRGKPSNGVLPNDGNVARRMSRARSARPATNRKSGPSASGSANVGAASGLAEAWVSVGSKGKSSGNANSAQIQSPLSIHPLPVISQHSNPPIDVAQVDTGKGKKVVGDTSVIDGLIGPDKESRVIPITAPKPITRNQSCNLASKVPSLHIASNLEDNVVSNPEPSKGMDVKKSARKSKKSAKGVPTSSAAK